MLSIELDMTALLLPITEENPRGKSLEYEPIYDDIRQARESDPDYLHGGEWTASAPRRADWEKVHKLCSLALTRESKDLQLCCWLVEAQTHLQGIDGIAIGLRFLGEFMTRFWQQCWPELDEDGGTIRYAKLSRLDRDISQFMYTCPLLQHESSSLAHWRKVLSFEHKVSSKPHAKDELVMEEGDFTLESFEQQSASFCITAISPQADRLTGILEQLNELDDCYLSLTKEENHALFSQTRQTLIDMLSFLRRMMQQYMPIDSDISLMDAIVSCEKPSTVTQHSLPADKLRMSRNIAINQMLDIAHFFRQSEPSSPVPFLMERAARWANMTLTEWLAEMLTDSNSLRDINHVLKGQDKS
ncbi:type VI secretion system protein TssA [Serratia sp. T13T92]|uniref:type VI secretion system protein TssA n=1 Tax=Serratia sp. T13T92 TaxID=3397496 RepID=UPI0039DFD9FE